MGGLIKNQEWHKALEISKELDSICSRTPILNYMMANIYKQLKNTERYSFHLQKAVDATLEYKVEKDLLNKIWEEKYLSTHPDALPENIDALKAENEAVKAENLSLKSKIELNDQERQFSQEMAGEAERKRYAAGMWTGVGLGSAGIALAGAGAGLLFTQSQYVEWKDVKNDPKSRVKQTTYWYTAMIGGGATLLIAGAVVAGVMGHYYAKSKSNAESLSFEITPASAGMTLKF